MNKIYKIGFFTLLTVVLFGSVILFNNSNDTNDTEKVVATESTESSVTNYNTEDEISAGRIIYAAYYDETIKTIIPKLYSVYFRGNDTFEFYEIDYSQLKHTEDITPKTHKEMAFTLHIDEVSEIGLGVEQFKKDNSYHYGTILSATYTNQNGNKMPATIARHDKVDYISVYLHTDGDVKKFGNMENVSQILLSIGKDYGTSQSKYSYIRMKEIIEVATGTHPEAELDSKLKEDS